MCLPPYPPTRGSPDAWEIVCVRMSGPGHSVVACVSGRQWDSPISSLLWGQTPGSNAGSAALWLGGVSQVSLPSGGSAASVVKRGRQLSVLRMPTVRTA